MAAVTSIASIECSKPVLCPSMAYAWGFENKHSAMSSLAEMALLNSSGTLIGTGDLRYERYYRYML
jgi:hypothetical protein